MQGAVVKGDKVILIDDLIATGLCSRLGHVRSITMSLWRQAEMRDPTLDLSKQHLLTPSTRVAANWS